MLRIPIILFLIISALPVLAQDYVRSENLAKEGIFFTYNDFTQNLPVEIKLFKRGSDIFFWDDSLMEEVLLDPQQVWGYSLNNQIYVSYSNAFWKLINQGKLNHFSAVVIQYYQSYDSFGFMVTRASKVLNHLFFDREDGQIRLLSKGNLEKYFQEDELLKKYYKKLNGNKTDKLILVLQAYNERHPE